MLRIIALLIITVALQAASFAEFARRAQAGEHLSVVFFGASLTWGANAADPQRGSYRALVARRLEHAYPDAHFAFHDAAIGGTGSQLGVFRLDRDVLAHQPDLVFLDFSANDDITSGDPETLASYEAILRRLVSARIPVVQVIFPFAWNVEKPTLGEMPRRSAHLALARAYGSAVGDAIALAHERIVAGAVTLKELWPYDGVHPGERGYAVFADAAWKAFQDAVAQRQECAAPATMLHAGTYLVSARVRLSSLGVMPAGWSVGHPNLSSAFFDMLMSRWLDDETIAARPDAAAPAPAPFGVRFRGEMVMLFGESTEKSGKFRALIDGKAVTRADHGATSEAVDGARLAKLCHGNVHLVEVLATGLDPASEHTLVIEPQFAVGEELRLESVCVAGAGAVVQPGK